MIGAIFILLYKYYQISHLISHYRFDSIYTLFKYFQNQICFNYIDIINLDYETSYSNIFYFFDFFSVLLSFYHHFICLYSIFLRDIFILKNFVN